MKAWRPPAIAVLALSLTSIARGAIVWDGPPITFTKASFADWTLPENQDQITSNIWLTRADTQGLFNIKIEPSYRPNLSPADTEWAFGTTADFSSLTYTHWMAWTGNSPPGTIGRDAVVHLITEDIYLDIKFTAWTSSGGGGFSYVRSTAPVPEPCTLGLCGMAALLMFARRRHRVQEPSNCWFSFRMHRSSEAPNLVAGMSD